MNKNDGNSDSIGSIAAAFSLVCFMEKKTILLLLASCLSFSLHAEIISFSDAKVKSLCIANWDIDNDGELSTDEAAAVKTLGQVFRNKSDIGSFPELKYFTGLTVINEYAFSGSSIGPEIVVPGNIKSLEAFCFYDCQQLNRVIIEDGVESIGFKAFSGPVTFISIPASIITINAMSINPYVNVNKSGISVREGNLTIQVSAIEPSSINEYAFYYLFGEGQLIVPFGVMNAYKAVSGWSHFGQYLEAGDVNGDGQLNVKDVTSLNAYIMGNSPTPFNERLADVNGDGNINVKDMTLMCSWIMQSSQQ